MNDLVEMLGLIVRFTPNEKPQTEIISEILKNTFQDTACW